VNINKTELTKIIIEHAEHLAESVIDMLIACGEHCTGGHVALKIRAKPNKAGKLVVESVFTSREPTGADTDEIFRGVPFPIATMDMDEDQGQERMDV
jgi:hypothetical protein